MIFSEGFSKMSYFNLIKEIVKNSYKNIFGNEKLIFGFVDKAEVNACCRHEPSDDSDLLYINTGTISEIMALFKTAFSQKTVFENIGDSKSESCATYYGKYEYRNNQHQILFNTRCPIIDSRREKLSTSIGTLAITFIAAHELGHIANGHTRYLNSTYSEPEIRMRNEKIKSSKDLSLDRRTLEMDADAAAATFTIETFISKFYKEKDNIESMGISSMDRWIELWGFTVACIFLKFEVMSGVTNYNPESYYLPNDARYWLVIGAARNALLSFNEKKFFPNSVDIELYDQAVINGLFEAEKLFSLMGKNTRFLARLENQNSNFVKYVNEVNNNWENRLRILLQTHSKVPLYTSTVNNTVAWEKPNM